MYVGTAVLLFPPPPGYSDLRTSTSHLFASPVSLKVLSSSFQEVCLSRLCLCRDILVLLFMMKRSLLVEVCHMPYKTVIIVQRHMVLDISLPTD